MHILIEKGKRQRKCLLGCKKIIPRNEYHLRVCNGAHDVANLCLNCVAKAHNEILLAQAKDLNLAINTVEGRYMAQ